MTSVLVASDLDRTLIYSRTALTLASGEPPELCCVEVIEQKPVSFMTSAAAAVARELSQLVTFVPVTTRTPEQLARVTLPGRAPSFAVAANGGVLLVNGIRDRGWDRSIARALRGTVPLAQVWDHVSEVCRPEWTFKIRNADGLFCYAVVERSALSPEFISDVTGWADARGWTISLQGNKLYWMPNALTKAAAVIEVATRIGADFVLAAGDSLLDRDLLECADYAIAPRHGELFDSNWGNSSVHVTIQKGVRAGQEILEWFLNTAGLLQGHRRSDDRRDIAGSDY